MPEGPSLVLLREAAERLRAAYENGRTSSSKTRKELATCFQALSMVSLERRTSTLVEVLQRKAVARELKTLLPAADHGLLQQVQATERPSNSRAALEKQTLLIRLGVALRAQGHGGLSGWVQSVVVEPQWRNRGIARQLMQHLLRWFANRGVDHVVLQSTESAGTLYQALGFTVSDERLLIRQEASA